MRKTIAALLLLAAGSAYTAESPPPRREMIDKIVKLSRVDDLEEAAITGVIDALVAVATTEEQKQALQQLRVRALTHNARESWVAAYDRAFDDQTLATLLAFYESRAGQRVTAVDRSTMAATVQERVKPHELTASERERSAARKTIADMRTLATALEARATDTNEYPDAADMEALRPLLEPVYVRTMPARDAWSHEFLYIGGPKKQTYRIVSAGADGVFDPRSRKMSESNVQTALALSDRYEDDIIFENGTFLQVPRDALNPDELRP